MVVKHVLKSFYRNYLRHVTVHLSERLGKGTELLPESSIVKPFRIKESACLYSIKKIIIY